MTIHIDKLIGVGKFLGKVLSVCLTVMFIAVKMYNIYIGQIIEHKNSKIVARLIVLEEFDRARYISLIDSVYSLLKNKQLVAQSELEFIIRFRSKFIIDNRVTEKKLEYIYEVYLERSK